MDLKYSVLMSVYKNEKTEYFNSSVESMLSQTYPPDDFVIVCDGPLYYDLDAAIDCFVNKNPELFQIIRLPENNGIGTAANIGLDYCKYDLVAKMDSDDIAVPTRCEQQLKRFFADPYLDIVGGQLAEFMGDKTNIISYRHVPLEHDSILNYARRRSPFNNQTVMYKKSTVLSIGGYSSLRRCEDYDLFIRMLQNNCLACNCHHVLVYYRITKDTLKRRSSCENLKCLLHVHRMAYINGFCGISDVVIPFLGQIILMLLPVWLKEKLYRCFLHKKNIAN